MLIGVLADSHGHAETTAKAVRMLLEHGADMLLHLGDIGSDEVIDELTGHHARIVFGNCDWNIDAMTRYARLVGIVVDHPIGSVEIDGCRIAFTHGDMSNLMQQALDNGVDYLLHGHTHTVQDKRIGRTRVINPGALHRATRYTAAVLDPSGNRVHWLEIEK